MADVAVLVDEDYHKGMLDVLPERVIRFRLPDLTIVYCNAARPAGDSISPIVCPITSHGLRLCPSAHAALQ